MKQRKQRVIYHLLGISIFIISTMTLAALLSRYMITNYLNENIADWIITCILFFTSMIANLTVIKTIKEKYLTAYVSNISVIIAILFTVSSMIEGPYDNVILRLGAILCGAITSYMSAQINHGNKQKHKRHYR